MLCRGPTSDCSAVNHCGLQYTDILMGQDTHTHTHYMRYTSPSVSLVRLFFFKPHLDFEVQLCVCSIVIM